MKLVVVICLWLYGSGSTIGVSSPSLPAQRYRELLFPNRSKVKSQPEGRSRVLLPDINNPPDGVDTAICAICRGLDYCTALNGFLIQEVYYPASNSQLGTCSIIDDLGKRMSEEIFGIGRTFRDTPQCRTIVMQYLCLFWGTENDMYTNLCYWKEETQDPDPTKHEVTGRPPCRSFCVQVFVSLFVETVIDFFVRSPRCAPIKTTSLTFAIILFAHRRVTSARQVRRTETRFPSNFI
jgi:hypothetical protein